MRRYQGSRYSFGYPACPDLEASRELFDVLKPEEFGIVLSETFHIHSEQSTSALVVHQGGWILFGLGYNLEKQKETMVN